MPRISLIAISTFLALYAAAAKPSKPAPAAPETPKPFEVPRKLEFQKILTDSYLLPSPDGTVFATGDMSGLYLWRFGDSKPAAQISWPVTSQWGGVTAIAISNDNSRVLMARRINNDTFELAVGDLNEEKILATLDSRPQRCSPPDWEGIGRCEIGGRGYFSPDGQRVGYQALYHSAGHTLVEEDTVYTLDGKVVSTLNRRHRYVKDAPMIWLDEKGGRQTLCRETPAGNLAVRTDPNACSILDCSTGKRLAFLDDCRESAGEVSWDGARITGVSSVWEAATGKLIATLKPGPYAEGEWRSPSIALSEGGRFAVERREYVAAAREQAVRLDLLEVDTGKRLARLESAVEDSTSLSGVSADGSIAFMRRRGVIELWPLGPGRAVPPATVRAPAAPVAVPAVDVDAPPRVTVKTDPDAFAVVVGVEKYRQAGIPAVDFAERDARAMHTYLTQAMGYDPKNVVMLIGGDATKTDFEKTFGKWLMNRVDAKSRVFVYYAGHGAPNPTTGEGFLMPYEADPSYVDETAYPVARLYAELAKLPAKSVTVVLDACFSGQGQRSLVAQGTRPLVMVKQAKAPEGLLVIAAASGTQISASDHAAKHGLLTYHLLAGLKGPADADKDGRITAAEAFGYARPAVERAARLQNVEQTPTMAGGASGESTWITLDPK